MSHAEELASLAREIEGAGWRTKPMSQWTTAEQAAYERWAAAAWADLRKHGRPEDFRVTIRAHDDPEEIGELLHITIKIDRRETDE